jgi:Na+/melibiose symporter-like transporter
VQHRLGFLSKFWYGFGQAAEGMKNTAFGVFLLLFYSQLLGLEAWLAGLALGLSLCLDAVSDPVAGSLSDSTRHRWGRRHPWMYASALPMWITFSLSFRPPAELGQAGLFAWMLVTVILARAAMALYHVPHLALGAELSDDYHERTSIVAWRLVFGLLGAVVLAVVCRQVFLQPTPEFPNGELNPAGYNRMGLFFGFLMMVAILLSAAGTHSRIPYLHATSEAPERFSPGRLWREMGEALSNRSFRNLFVGVLLFFIARGLADALGIYMSTFFWRIGTGDVLLLPAVGALGIAIGAPFFTVVGRRMDKKRLFEIGVWWFSILTLLLPTLKIVDFYPPFDSPFYLGLIYAFVFLAAFGAGASLVASGSMMADIADEHEYTVGRRQEGVFFGALSFSGKAAAGVGIGLAGIALSLISFPKQVKPDQVPIEIIDLLGIIAGPGVAGLMIVGAIVMTRYHLTQERITEIQLELEKRRAAARAAGSAAQSAASADRVAAPVFASER